MTHIAQVRAVVLTDYLAVAHSRNLNGIAMLREFGIDPRQLEEPENRIPASAVTSLLAASARRSGCEVFGLLLARNRQFSSLGPLSLLMRNESSLRAVIRRLRAYRRLISDIFDLDLEERADKALIRIDLPPQVANRQSVELTMALAYRFLSDAMFGGWRPSEVHFRYRPPADSALHLQAFRAPLRFDAAFNGFVVPLDMLDRPNAHADAGFVEHVEQFLDLLLRDLPEASLPDQVCATIRRMLAGGTASLETTAGALGMHPRTLQRRLAGAGTNFAELIEDVRGSIARDLLDDTSLPLGEVASLVGYASHTSFGRWFSAANGSSPGQWRRRHRPPRG